jgi:hypothetical protein
LADDHPGDYHRAVTFSLQPGNSPEQLPTPTLPISATPSLTATPAPTAMPIIEPVLPTLSAAAELPVQPPDFNLPSSASEVGLTFDFVDAHAVYAYYRQQEGPGMWANDADFTSAMKSYSETLANQGINLQQVTVEGQTFSLLTNGNQILLNFKDGVLSDVDPGRWSKDSTPEWIDVGGPVELFIGDDGHAYIAKVDTDGNVTAFLNPISATIDNLDQQWIEVKDGQSVMVWEAQKGWVENPMAFIPAEWQGKIERVMTLDDGRTVAIADLNPNEADLQRVLQLDEAGQWMDYQPEIGVIPAYERYFGKEWHESLTIPEVINPVLDINGNQFPLGYLGKVARPEDAEKNYHFISGVIMGTRVIPEQKCTEIVVGFPTSNGDYMAVSFVILNISESPNLINTLLGSHIDVDKLVDGEYGFDELVLQSSSKKILDKNPISTKPFANFLANQAVIGTQLIFAPHDWEDVDVKENLFDALQGKTAVYDGSYAIGFYMWAIPDSMQGMLDD